MPSMNQGSNSQAMSVGPVTIMHAATGPLDNASWGVTLCT
jgi:hypothetical protein